MGPGRRAPPLLRAWAHSGGLAADRIELALLVLRLRLHLLLLLALPGGESCKGGC